MRTQPSRSFAWRRRRWRTLARLALGCVVMGFGATGAAHAVSERRHVDARTGMLEVPLEELVVAVRRKDRAELARVAASCEALAEPAVWPKGGLREPIWEQTRQLARRLAVAPATPPDDAVEMLDCLDPTLASDRQLQDGMRAHKKTPLGERAAAILDRPAARAP